MTKRNKILAGIILSAVVSTSLVASNNNFDRKDDNRATCSMKMNKDDRGFHKKGHGQKEPVLGLVKQLNLSDDQKTKIKDIMIESRKNMKTENEAFTKTSFDKNKYMDIMNQKRENMLKSRADMIEKIYTLLTVEQKEQLKVLMDLRKEKMNNFSAKMGKNS